VKSGGIRWEDAFLVQLLSGIGPLPVLLVDRDALFRSERIDGGLEACKRPLNGIAAITIQLLLRLGQMLPSDFDFGFGTH